MANTVRWACVQAGRCACACARMRVRRRGMMVREALSVDFVHNYGCHLVGQSARSVVFIESHVRACKSGGAACGAVRMRDVCVVAGRTFRSGHESRRPYPTRESQSRSGRLHVLVELYVRVW